MFCFLFSRRNRVTACPLLCVYKYTDRVDAYTRFRPARLLGYWLGTSLRLHETDHFYFLLPLVPENKIIEWIFFAKHVGTEMNVKKKTPALLNKLSSDPPNHYRKWPFQGPTKAVEVHN